MKSEIYSLINDYLHDLMINQQVKILYACESGSRAWGFPSPDSDYDVRFIYVHPREWYLRLHEERDVIDLPISPTDLGVLDIGGWDLRKTLRLLGKSNPVIWEWLQSPIMYQMNSAANLLNRRNLLDSYYSPVTACHHYLAICRRTMSNELQDNLIKIKKYFYMIRPLLAALWIAERQTIPPMEFKHLLEGVPIQTNLLNCIEDLWQQKQQNDEQVPIKRITLLDGFLMNESERLQYAAARLPSVKGDLRVLDSLFLELLNTEMF